MRVSPGFRAFVLDQLSEVPDLRAESMFGGVGLYSGDVFFGIIAADVLYFKVGDANRIAYQQAGARPFKPFIDRPMSRSYYSVPALIPEDATVLRTWVAGSLEIARNTRGDWRAEAPPAPVAPIFERSRSGAYRPEDLCRPRPSTPSAGLKSRGSGREESESVEAPMP